MINTILFDLDGTLLPLDTDAFLRKYFNGLSIKFKDYFAGKELTELIWASTKYAVGNMDSTKTNKEAFFEDFFTRTNHPRDLLVSMFDEFYENDFRQIKDITTQSELMIKAVLLLKEKGYEMVVATNPIFPRSAVIQRIQWAGVNKEDFKLITSFENMHFCKPNPAYFQEILETIGKTPKECMMVGNDLEEDMISKKIGLTTYLIEDYMIARKDDVSNVDHRGNYKTFYDFVVSLPTLK
ncbi:HAD family hydrolase [Alkaliphilus hydrothermalis]|uniref:HAD superfamily hydrolase (TIGR01549 family) n=1 Tax=Alkaliphilus hydrothermalis TaxID=1482730 RepID=A0ABS2NQU1_9FIRM|nr:HAD family hydrolase [Alkaliphilus hydrothermalis]MBM7615252.1 HAD superfamily hydrolase (TIGR01549 family) [Alkaliphilus hydrothermalis]